jgi:hypothetical protein
MKTLILSNSFFGYAESIKKELTRKGHTVTLCDTRPKSFFFKAILRFFPSYSFFLVRANIKKIGIIENINYVLIIKGEGVSKKLIEQLKYNNPKLVVSLYLWDSAEVWPYAKYLSNFADRTFTFDFKDSESFGWKYKPLFADFVVNRNISSNKIFKYSFIASNHTIRQNYVRSFFVSNDVKTSFTYFYFQNSVICSINIFLRAFDSLLKRCIFSDIALSRSSLFRIFSESQAVLDVTNPGQTGLTMRTIECLVSGIKIVTNNEHIKKSNLYHESRVFVLGENLRVSNDFLETNFLPIPKNVSDEYLVENWVDEFICENDSLIQNTLKKTKLGDI